MSYKPSPSDVMVPIGAMIAVAFMAIVITGALMPERYPTKRLFAQELSAQPERPAITMAEAMRMKAERDGATQLPPLPTRSWKIVEGLWVVETTGVCIYWTRADMNTQGVAVSIAAVPKTMLPKGSGCQ